MAKPPPPPSRRKRAGLPKDRDGAGSGKRWGLSKRWRRVLGIFAAVLALSSGILGGLVAYAALTLPDVDSIGQHTGTIKIVDRQGRLLAEVGHDNQHRTTVPISQVSQVMKDATVAAEDRNFYNEGAFDVKRILKALFVDTILRRPEQGASTITQQLAKQAFFGAQAEKSPLRKLREALLANELNSKFTKDQILEMYFNLTYYGDNAYGIEDAATRYFGKHAAQLTLPEAAMLAGLPQAPSADNPYASQTNAFSRMHYVLYSLQLIGKVSSADAAAVDPYNVDSGYNATTPNPQHQAAIIADLKNGQPPNTGPAPHFVQYVQDQLTDELANDPSYLQGDLVVTTTLNLDYQNLADQVVPAGVKQIGHKANNGALLMMDPHNGDILAMVGSADYNDDSIAGQYNVTTAMRRPGSSFKPYVYETGFKNGSLRPDTTLHDSYAQAVSMEPNNPVHDFDNSYDGNISAARALLGSRNVAAEEAMQIAGVTNVQNFAYSLGIDPNTEPIAPNLSSAIGTSAIRMIDHTAAYAAFANYGHKVQPRAILKITDGNGNVLVDHTQDTTDLGVVMSPSDTWTLTNILRRYAQTWNLPFKWDTAGKSGTTDDFVDAWYMVYSPDWVVATWAGHTDGNNPAEVPMDQVYGTTEARYIAVPFVNGLPQPHAWSPQNGSVPDCATGDQPLGDTSGCPTPTPTPTPSPTPTPTPTEAPTPAVTPPPLLTPCPSPSPAPSPSPTPGPPPVCP